MSRNIPQARTQLVNPTNAANTYLELTLDAAQRLRISGVVMTGDPTMADLPAAPSTFISSAVVASAVIKASPGRLLSLRYEPVTLIIGTFFQIHDKAAVAVLGDVPILTFQIGIARALPLTLGRDFFGPAGPPGTLGITWGISTTALTFTAAAVVVAQTVSGTFI